MCSACSVQCVIWSVQCAVRSVQCAVHSVQCAVCSLQYSFFSGECSVFSVKCAVCSANCALYGVQVCSVQCRPWRPRYLQCREGWGRGWRGQGSQVHTEGRHFQGFCFLLGGGLGLGLEQGARELEGLEGGLGIKEEDMRDYLYLGTPIALVGAVEIVQCVLCSVQLVVHSVQCVGCYVQRVVSCVQ